MRFSQITEIKPSKVQTHNFDVSFRKTSKTGDGTKQFKGNALQSLSLCLLSTLNLEQLSD